ncbi:triacylglycerol lipase 2 [Capsicum galapagoense]
MEIQRLLMILGSVALIISVFESHPTFGSSNMRGPFGFVNGGDNGLTNAAAPSEMCATCVTIRGYKCQEYEVTTDDGYILGVQRIPEGRVGGGGQNRHRQPVLLQHGVLVDGVTWLMNSAEQSLPMILADSGFDVWIANTRGTRYSLRHLNLDPKDPDYWNWSWDDLVVHDLPTVVNLVYKQTGQKIHFVGHSLGTLIALASLSEGRQPDKIKSAALLSPIAYLSHMTTALGVITARSFIGEISTMFGLAEFNPSSGRVSNFVKALCAQPGINCFDFLTAVTGKNCCLNASTIDFFLKNEPQPTSTKNFVHLGQTVRDGMIRKFDYGTNKNLAHYGEAKPPEYNLGNIPRDLPLFISYGGQDALSDSKDVETLLDHLKFHDVGKLHVQYVKEFAHADFIIGTTAKDIVFNKIVTFFKNQQ